MMEKENKDIMMKDNDIIVDDGNEALAFGGGQIPDANIYHSVLANKRIPNHKLYGIHTSFRGMAKENCYEMLDKEIASKIEKLLGTYLKTCRKVNPAEDKFFIEIVNMLKKYNIRKLIITGGDGSARALVDFDKKLKQVGYYCRIYYTPCTIDGIEGTFGLGLRNAVGISTEVALAIGANAFSTYDEGMICPRVAVIGLMGRNRNDILYGTTDQIIKIDQIGNYKLDEIRLILLPTGYVWDMNHLVNEVERETKPVLILASEGAKPTDILYGFLQEEEIARAIKKVLESLIKRKVNYNTIGYLAQTHFLHKEQIDATKEEAEKWATYLDYTIDNIPYPGEPVAVVYDGKEFSTMPLETIASLNPRDLLARDIPSFCIPYLL